MNLSVHVYDILRCGYYRRGQKLPVFGSISDVLDSLNNWINPQDFDNRPRILETSTFQIGAQEQILPCYCFSLLKNGNDYLLTLWNKSQTLNNKFASIPENSTVGAAVVNAIDVPENNIPGYPTYFWILPDSGLVLTIQAQSSLRGIAEFNAFMKGFLTSKSRWAVGITQNRTTETRIGYSRTGRREDIDPSLEVGFRIKIAKNKGEVDYFRQNYRDIRKTVRKASFDILGAREKAHFTKFFTKALGLNPGQDVEPKPEASFKVELDFTPTREKLESIFRNWNQSEHTDSYDDIGFIFRGETAPRWIQTTIVKLDIAIEVRLRTDAPMIDPNSLMERLAESKGAILEQIPERENDEEEDG